MSGSERGAARRPPRHRVGDLPAPAIYYHYGKHLFADRPDEYRAAHDAMLRCYTAAAPDMTRRRST